MGKHLAVVLRDPEILHELFGANDGNLTLVEELLGVRIFVRGNQVYLDSADDRTRQTFISLLSQMEDHIRLGQLPGPDLIRALHNTIDSEETEALELFKGTSVAIPNGERKVFARSRTQAIYLREIERSELVFGIGPAGTGKTFLAVAQALKAVMTRMKRKLILTRPVVEAGESLGYLPGDLEQKINPYLRPLYDAMELLVPQETIRRLEDNRQIEIAPLAYMRGRTLSSCFVILDEAQNTTREQIKMFLTRIGEGSKVVVTGDITQIDLPRRKDSGLLNVIPILKPIEEIRFIFFGEQDVVRHPLVRKIVRAYETAEER